MGPGNPGLLFEKAVVTGLKAVAIGSVAGLIAIPVAKAALWGGKKVMQMANEQKSPWKSIALKIAAIALYTIGTLATIVASAGIAIGTTVFLGGSLGIVGALAAGPYGAIPGTIIGLFTGAVAAGGIIAMAWNTVMDPSKPEKEI